MFSRELAPALLSQFLVLPSLGLLTLSVLLSGNVVHLPHAPSRAFLCLCCNEQSLSVALTRQEAVVQNIQQFPEIHDTPTSFEAEEGP